MLLAFVIASLVVLLIPGPGVLYVVTQSLSHGRNAGIVSVLGLSVGALIQAVAAALGLAAVVLASATAFGVVKLLGAGYLVYLGIQAMLVRPGSVGMKASGCGSSRRLFIDGIVVSALNPKIAIFFLAFLPQFVEPANGPVSQQILFLGVLYVALALLTDGTYALLASRLRNWLSNRVLPGALPHRFRGAMYIGLGVSAALADRR